MKMINVEDLKREMRISKRQLDLIRLNQMAYGECIIWGKGKKAKIIMSDELYKVVS